MLVQELATRINHAKPKVVLAGSCGIEPSGVIPYQPLVNSAIELATHKPEKVRGTDWRHARSPREHGMGIAVRLFVV
jgi:acyl-coenzyme A synthetase/AMP-(fatty) acid ligase